MDLYATKGAVNARLVPLVDRLAAAGVTPDQVTLAAIPVAIVAGACLLASPDVPVLLLVVPLLVVVRIVLNLIDGNMARRTGRIHARGELYNEVGRPARGHRLPRAGGVPARRVATGRAARRPHRCDGVVRRDHGEGRGRRADLPGHPVQARTDGAAHGLLHRRRSSSVPADTRAWAAFGPLLLLGTALTLVERIVVAIRRLP